MKRAAIILGILLIVAVTAGTALYLSGIRIAAGIIADRCNVDIAYTGADNAAYQTIAFTDLRIADRQTGVGFLAKRAVIRPRWATLSLGRLTFDLDMSQVSFIKHADEGEGAFESFEDIAALPFTSQWTYRTVNGAITVYNGAVTVAGLKAANDMIKFDVSGDFMADATIDTSVTIQFAEELFAGIPKKFLKGVLKDEGGGWQSFSMKVKGNYKNPSIQVTGNQFRLSIGPAPIQP